MTQRQLADAMNISDKTISKWERGLGCPDVSLLSELSEILGVSISKILLGDLEPNDADGGNGGRLLITYAHEMSKEHYLSFVAYVAYDRVLFVKLYPEQSSEVRFPKMHEGKLYFYCIRHGLWVDQL